MSVDVLHNAITVDARDNLPTNAPYGVEGMKKFIFLHGANVSEPNAEIWGDQLFKRLWHTGCQVDFYNVDWRSDMGTDVNYQQNVVIRSASFYPKRNPRPMYAYGRLQGYHTSCATGSGADGSARERNAATCRWSSSC